MAKIVSTKYGDRRLVYLPPINLQKTKTPNVETIETDRQVPDRYLAFYLKGQMSSGFRVTTNPGALGSTPSPFEYSSIKSSQVIFSSDTRRSHV